MGVSAQWQDMEKQAIQMTFCAPWTWAEYERASTDITTMLASVQHRVDIHIHMAKAGVLPTDSMFRLRESYADLTPNLGEYVFIGAPDEFKSMMRVTDRYYTALGGTLAFSFA